MKHRILPYLGIVVLVLGIALCPSPPRNTRVDPNEILQKVIDSEEKASYLAVQRFFARTVGGEAERILKTSKSGAKIDIGNTRSINLTKRSIIWGLVKRNYTPLIEGEDTIAGRPVWVLRLKPSMKRRPWRQMWVDKETGVILASRDWTSENRIKASMKTLEYCVYKESEAKDHSLQPNDNDETPQGFARRDQFIPEQFVLVREYPLNRDMELREYSDGLFQITVMKGDLGEMLNESPIGIFDYGLGKVCHEKRGDRHIIVIADLPVVNIKKIASSIH